MMNHLLYTPCAEWKEQLAATHPDDLSPSDRAALERHVATCSACAAVRAEYHIIDALILDSAGVEPLPDLPTWLLQPRKEQARLNDSHAPVLLSSLAALAEQDSLQSFFVDGGDIEVPSPLPPERSFSQAQRSVENAGDRELSSPVPALSGPPGMMSLAELADHCMSEINHYRRGEACSDQYCLELFRRAILQRDHSAWALLQERFQELLLGSFRRHPMFEAASRLDSPENYVARAFERFWFAVVQNQQVTFTTLVAALQYMQVCLNGAILDTLRAHSRAGGVALPELGFAGEPAVKDDDDGRALREAVQGILPNERERRLADLLYHHNLKSREIEQVYPQEFPQGAEIYRLRRNIMERVLRDVDQIRWKRAMEPGFSEPSAMEDYDDSQQLQGIVQDFPATEWSAREAKVQEQSQASIKQGYLIMISTEASIPLTWEVMLIGRQDPTVGIFPEINLVDMKVGRRHAYLRNRQGIFTVQDLNSVNKTYLNGVALVPHQETPLKDGDILRFGSVEVRFELH
jgi:hypothetical protein